jgi:hypothetical protein
VSRIKRASNAGARFKKINRLPTYPQKSTVTLVYIIYLARKRGKRKGRREGLKMIACETFRTESRKKSRQNPHPLNNTAWMMKRIRRRIEDHLRKEATDEQILAIAEFLKIKKGFGL